MSFDEVHFYHDAAVGVDVALVADQVAHGVDDDFGVTVVAGDGVEGKVLHHMGVATDDGVAAVGEEPAGGFFLFAVGFDGILDTPMDEGDDEVGPLLTGHLQVACHFGGVDEVDDVGADGGDAVGAVGVGEQGKADAAAVDYQGMLHVALVAVAVGAQMGYAESVEGSEGAFQPLLATIHAMVVGGGHDVEAGVACGFGEGVGGRELRVAAVGSSGQRHLEVEDGQVGTLHIILNIAEAGFVIVTAIGMQGGVVLRHVPHEVAGEDNLHRLGLS